MGTWRVVAAIVTGPALSLLGVALATNFRGVTEWHVRQSMSTASGLRRVPHEERIARLILLERVMGLAFAVAGVMILVTVGYSVLAGQPMQTVK